MTTFTFVNLLSNVLLCLESLFFLESRFIYRKTYITRVARYMLIIFFHLKISPKDLSLIYKDQLYVF